MKYCQITGTYSKNIPLTINDAMANGSDKRVKFMTGGMARLFCSTTVIKTVILTRQFRFPVFINGHQGDLIEAAAGLLDNMDPESRIKAEAEEETGFKVSSVQKIFEAYMSPGSVTEKLYFYLAEYQPKDKTSAGGGIKAEGEDIDVLELL
jgi:nudix-type nucleoside diphosphatase (YffH/AdpP family)